MFRSTFFLSTRLASLSLTRTPAAAAVAHTPVLAAARSNAFAHAGLRAFSAKATTTEDGFKIPALYPKEVKLNGYLQYCAKRRAEVALLGEKITLKQLGPEWKELSQEEKDMYPSITEIKQAPKIKSEIYPKVVKGLLQEEPDEGADFEHFFRLHKKAVMKKNEMDEDEARDVLTDVWNDLEPDAQSAYSLTNDEAPSELDTGGAGTGGEEKVAAKGAL